MPLPVAHSLAGGSLFVGLDADGRHLSWKRALLAIILANAPDLDFLPGMLIGDPNRFHHGPSHSLGMAVFVAVLAAGVAALGYRWPLRRGGSAPRGAGSAVAGTAMIVGLLWTSHILLDAVTADLLPPYGVPLLWPLSSEYFLFWPWFPHVLRIAGPSGAGAFLMSLLNAHNLWAATVEILTLAPVLVLVAWIRRRKE